MRMSVLIVLVYINEAGSVFTDFFSMSSKGSAECEEKIGKVRVKNMT